MWTLTHSLTHSLPSSVHSHTLCVPWKHAIIWTGTLTPTLPSSIIHTNSPLNHTKEIFTGARTLRPRSIIHKTSRTSGVGEVHIDKSGQPSKSPKPHPLLHIFLDGKKSMRKRISNDGHFAKSQWPSLG